MSKQTEELRPEFDKVHLQWFGAGAPQNPAGATGPTAGDQTGTTGAPGTPSPDQGTGPAQTSVGTISKAEYDKLKAEHEHLLGIHQEMKAKKEAREREEQKKRGEFEELYNAATKELEAIKPERNRYKAAVEESLKAELANLPSGFDASLIPDIDPVAKLAWLGKARASGLLAPAKGRGDQTPPATEETRKGLASLYTKM